MESLVGHPERRFIWGESCFVHSFLKSHGDLMFNESMTAKQVMLHLIHKSKQWEFVGGGWVQHDEALVPFETMVDQMTGKYLDLCLFNTLVIP